MNIKCLMTASVFALVSASAAQAADVVVPYQSVSEVSVTHPVVAPAFSWTGFYVGAQVGGFSSKTDAKAFQEKYVVLSDESLSQKDAFPKPSGFVGGVYAGSNVDIGSNLVLGVDTDFVMSGRKDQKSYEVTVTDANKHTVRDELATGGVQYTNNEPDTNDVVIVDTVLKEKWAGATRVRLGYAIDRVLPYVAGGIAYAKVQGIKKVSTKVVGNGYVPGSVAGDLADESKAMVGYAVGAGVDFAVSDNVVVRAEYRYTDFGKKKFEKNDYELKYKTNNFRVGVAYKF